MVRSVWKGPFCEIERYWNPSREFKSAKEEKTLKDTKKMKIWSRRSIILPEFIGYNFLIYNGKTFISLIVSEDMVGHKFGEFANTRKKPIHKKKTQTKKRK